METNKLPLNFSSNVMAAIEQEVARRERQEEILMYAGIAGACLALLGALGYLGYKYQWIKAVIEWFHVEEIKYTPTISPIWIPVLISSLLLVCLYYYLYERKRKETISHV